jgi:hypothetical protein
LKPKDVLEKLKRIPLPRRPRPRHFEDKFARDAAYFGSPRGWKRASARRLLLFSLCCGGGIVLFLSIYLASGLWRVSEVNTHDGALYSAAQVLDCAQVEAGESMLSFDTFRVARDLREHLPLLRNVKVRRSLKGTVTISFEEERVAFSVTGYGHGVGMSQYGANVLASEGADYRAILGRYYPGTAVEQYTFSRGTS